MSDCQLPLVTVVVPVFNRAGTINRTLDSIRAQTWSNTEIIVVDDASLDNTVSVVMARADAGDIQIISLGRNGGACRARNQGLNAASGAYVAFLDSDDVWHPRFLEVMTSLLESADLETGCAAASYRTVFADGRVKSQLIQSACGNISKGMLEKNLVGATSCVLLRTAVVRAVGGFNEAYPACQDYELFIRLSYATRFVSTTEVLYTHIDWDDPGRLTRNPRKRLKALMMLYRDYLRDHLKSNPGARATFAGYLADQLMRAGRQRGALRMFIIYASFYPIKLKNIPRILMAFFAVTPTFYAQAVDVLSRLDQVLATAGHRIVAGQFS